MSGAGTARPRSQSFCVTCVGTSRPHPTHLVLNSYVRFSPPDSGKSAASPVRLADETATFLEPGNCILIPSAGSFTSRNCLVQNGFRALAGGSAILGILRA